MFGVNIRNMEYADALLEEKKLMTEAKYRNYMTNIDKALRNFEYSSEWADLISALGKLSKAISSNTQYQIIPRRIKISKRLAQCMHPALPSGVHLKALETYAVIFSKTGPERLATELFIYSAGLFPLLGYAAMNVRPTLLGIYETYFVPLGEKLRPALSGFLSGVLPGYECGLDHFDRTNSLLTQVCSAVNPTHFYTVLWECVATNASIRLPAISFLLDHFNKRLGMQEQVFIMGQNRELMMIGLCACLNDSVILVQRNSLEFLLLGFPMHTIYLTQADLIKLVTNGLNTILRRDMSLNRRLYSWLLGTEISKNSPTYDTVSSDGTTEISESYFEKYSKQIVIQSVICTLKYSLETTPVDLKPYRIMVSLLDKMEIGSAVLDYVLCDIIRTMSISSGNIEVVKSANLLFATFDPVYIWSFMTSMYQKSCKKENKSSNLPKQTLHFNDDKFQCEVGSGDPGLIEICYLTEFLLETISLEMYNETTRLYLPKVFLAITQLLTIHLENISTEEISASLKLCMKIVSRVQPMITSPVKVVSRQSQGYLSSDEKDSTHSLKTGQLNVLEKSKSDSKLNQFDTGVTDNLHKSKSLFNEGPIGILQSNQNAEPRSPKKKKSKSFSKLSELDKEICPDTGQVIDPPSSSDLDTPRSIKKLKTKIKTKNQLSPKKGRPVDISIYEPKSLDLDMIKKADEVSEVDELNNSTKLDNINLEKNGDVSFDFENFNTENANEFSILEKCIRQYEIFFEIFLSRQILQLNQNFTANTDNCNVTVELVDENLYNVDIFKNDKIYEDFNSDRSSEIDKLFKTLLIKKVSRISELENLLTQSLTINPNGLSDKIDQDIIRNCELNEYAERQVQMLIDLHLTSVIRNATKLAANLLVEMSTFPNCRRSILMDKSQIDIPSWLKVLCLVSCYALNDIELQLTAITTLFDLISLLKSQTEHSTSPGVTFVIMLPLLKFGHVSYIECRTRVFQLITSILWNCLGEPNVDPAQISALLHQLHNCLESGLVEKIIGDRMYAHNMQQQFAAADALMTKNNSSIIEQKAFRNYQVDRAADIQLICASPLYKQCVVHQLKESESKGLKKFELLWHLGREKNTARGFEKTLLKVLDTLSLPYYMPVRTFTTKWLQSALLRGDLSRLIKPLYKILLSPNSKRIGLVQLQLIQSNAVDDMTTNTVQNNICDVDNVTDKEVYAISSEYGNIKYHMDVTSNKKRSPIRSFHKKIFGVTLGNKNKTSNFVSDKVSSPTVSADIQDTNIGLIINPLDNSPDFDDDPKTEEHDFNINLSEDTKISTPMSQNDLKNKNSGKDGEESMYQNYVNDYTDNSDSSVFDYESENRETSVEKDESINDNSNEIVNNNLKRFVGDCERVTEILSQHERTKNRKTYRLTREKTPGDSSIASTTDEQSSLGGGLQSVNTEEDAAHPADEYFNKEKNLDCDDNISKASKEHTSHIEISAIRKSISKTVSKKQRRKKDHKSTSKKAISPNEKKRMSCISKTSTDSNNSYAGIQGSKSISEEGIVTSVHSDEEIIVSQSTGTVDTICTIHVEEKRRSLSFEINKTKTEWDITPETIEKSKQNLQILRRNVASSDGSGSKRASTKSAASIKSDIGNLQANKLQFFHNHMLIYLGIYDTKQILYAFQTIRNIIACDTRTFLCLSITTSFASNSLKQLLIRHRKSIAGKGFLGNITNSEFSQSYRGCMHLEVLVTMCLYYARGFFHPDCGENTNEKPTYDDILGNCRVQLESVELLTLICIELMEIVKSMGKGLACYIADLMARCKLQKVILHCLNSSVNSFGQHCKTETFAEQTINYNNPEDEYLNAESFQVQLLRLMMAVIKLEFEVAVLKNESLQNGTSSKEESGNISPTQLSSIISDTSATACKYLPNSLINQQPMFLAAVLNALQNNHMRHLHRNWTDLITSSLNCFSFGSLTNIVISVLHQLCNNLDHISKVPLKEQCGFPPDYVVSQLEAITILCHYCLLDNTQQTTLSHLFNQAYPQTSVVSQNFNTGQLINNIVHSFLSSAVATSQTESQAPRNPQLLAARNAVLSHLSRIVASVAAIWDSELGQVRQVKQQLMEFLSPVSLHHGANFLAAVAVTWQERGEQHHKKNVNSSLSIAEQYIYNSTPQACPEQLSLVTLVSSIRVMPMDSFVQTLHQVVKSPPSIHRPPAYLTLEVSALELFYFYMKSAPAPQLRDSWSSLLLLLRDSLSLMPPAQFALLMLLNEFVQRCPQMPFLDKKDIRDLHDITSRLVDSLSNIAGSCLEQTTWLRRNLAVKEDISTLTTEGYSKDTSLNGQQQYSVQAQSVLAASLANLLDVAYGSQEKDKVVAIITTLLYNITPYLKNHTTRNIPSFYACSSLLASLSGYQYTRKAWRKDMLDLLLDNAFFQMDISCLPFWKQIMDSLMTYDNTTFRELMSRVSLTQTGSLNIFTSREQEYEQRAMLLKRLAFVIFCSEFDQYNKYMPEIQEQLANSLRLLSMIPSVQAAVFLCFRVLLLRMSPDHVTSLWPIIIAEMVQVFLSMEQELKTDCEDLSQQMRLLSGMDASWSPNSSSNGINTQSSMVSWRLVQLEASKLLELGCVLPAKNLPHFQMYRWAFVGTEFDAHEEISILNGNIEHATAMLSTSLYVPHIRRIARLMDMKYANSSPIEQHRQHLVLHCQQISTLQDLHNFFNVLSVTCPNSHNYANTEKEVANCMLEIEEVLSRDFLEKMVPNTTPR
ncbi:protein dopey-1 homolog [Teleopsis dalmanni]|uniref:protein dopey-1 homolog n=1 Tax=Teleopsis dalmanni TaxID=139649 RepID=UPI0018CD3D2D|nr:protein dopey-1 homolog [Teleopsis dalmanni]